MKKISAVLLVLVLVGSVAFASFTGSATTEFGFNLDNGEYGFDNSTSVTIDVALMEALGEAKGEGDIYADISASLSFTFSNADASDLDPVVAASNVLAIDGDEALVPLYVTFEFDHAKIVGDDWYVGILGALGAPNFASSAIDEWEEAADGDDGLWGYLSEKATHNADFESSVSDLPGLEVGYMGYKLGLGVKGDVNDEEYGFYGAVETPEFDVADGLLVSFGAAGLLSDSDKAVSGSAKAAFETDEYSASLAADMNYDDDTFDFEVALAASYDIFSMDAYYATRAMFDGSLTNNAIDNLLSAQVVVDLDPMKVTVKGLDLVNDQDLSANVEYQVSDELLVGFGGGYVIGTEDLSVSADLTYEVDMYKAYLEADFGYNLDTEDDSLELVLGVESTTLVAGATLYGEWESGNLLAEGFGAITVGAKIEF